jgi:integrase
LRNRKDVITGKRKGILYEALQQLDSLMATGEKRSDAKAVARARGESTFAFTDGKIHAFETRNNYQKIIMRFIYWCRDHYGINRIECLYERAEELASDYLSERIVQGYSAWTLQTERSALRIFFQNRDLTCSVILPQRKRENIIRSRRPAVRDQHFQPDNWLLHINFCKACGLRREELRDLHVREVYYRKRDGQLVVYVAKGKGGKDREVPVFPGRELSVLEIVEGREPDEHVFDRIPSDMDIHAVRRQFAQELYEHISGRPLPPMEGRLRSADLDRDAALYVSRCLGHNRIDIIFGHYIR